MPSIPAIPPRGSPPIPTPEEPCREGEAGTGACAFGHTLALTVTVTGDATTAGTGAGAFRHALTLTMTGDATTAGTGAGAFRHTLHRILE